MPRRHGSDPGALVVGASRIGLSIVRSLGRRGVETWVMPSDDHCVAQWSRYASRRLRAPASNRQLPGELLAIAEANSLDGWMLIGTDDDEVEQFAAHRDELSERFRVAVPRTADIAWALDKRETYALAGRLGLDHPRTWDAGGPGALDNPELVYPLIVKPRSRPRAVAAQTPKAWRADNREELEHAMTIAGEALAAEQLMLQELIPGGGEQQLAYAALCRDGVVLASLAARRRRQWPPDFGMASTYVETIDDGELAEPAQRVLSATRFTGIVELEFKRDPRDGRLAILDVNPRGWGWMSLGPSAGVDFPYLLFQMLIGEEVPRTHGRPGVRWVRMATDVPAAVAGLREGTLTRASYARSLRPPLACAVFASDDPLPALIDGPSLLAIGARRRLRAGRGHARRAARPRSGGDSGRDRAARRALILLENAPFPNDTRVWNEAQSLQRAGWDVSILAPHAWHRKRRPDDEVIDGVRVRRFPLRPAEASKFGHAQEYLTAGWRMWRELRRMAREAPFDVIHACNPPDFLLLLAVGQRRRGTRLVFDHHDLSPELYASRSEGSSATLRRALLALERLAFTLADVTLATNGSVARVAIERNGMPSEKVFIVRNGPVLSCFTPVDPAPELSRGREHLVVYVGEMGPQDGIDHAVHALAHLRRRRSDWHALFLGDGEALPGVRALASELGLDDRIEFAGFRSEAEVRRAICSADVCLAPDPRNPYTDCSTLVKIAEYMAMSRPTVSYDLVESRATADGAAVYVAGNDPADFARRIDDLLGDPELRQRLGSEGRARVERELAWEYSEQALVAAYERAIGAEPPDAPEAPEAPEAPVAVTEAEAGVAPLSRAAGQFTPPGLP